MRVAAQATRVCSRRALVESGSAEADALRGARHAQRFRVCRFFVASSAERVMPDMLKPADFIILRNGGVRRKMLKQA